VPFAAGALLIVIAGWSLRSLLWITSILRRSPWVVAKSMVIEARLTVTARLLAIHDAPDDGQTLAAPIAWRSPPLVGMEPNVWVAGTGRRFIIAAPGGAPLLRARRAAVAEIGMLFEEDMLQSRLERDEH
jgi:hypothetical protein